VSVVHQVRRAGRRKTEVLEAAAAVIASRGAEATRFIDVSEASGVPISTLQYYFGSREDLLVAAFRHASEAEIAQLSEELEAVVDPWAKLIRIVETALTGYGPDAPGVLWVEAWRFAMRDAEMRADVLKDNAAWRAVIAGAVTAGLESGAFRGGADPERIAVLTLALVDGVGLPLALGDGAVPPAVARETVLGTLAQILGVSLPRAGASAGRSRSKAKRPS
jgi:AcrR family transcriptional regulator